MTGNFTRAAEINKPIHAGQPTMPPPEEWPDLADGRTQVMHVLYVTVHGVTVGIAEHAAMISEQLRRDSLRKMTSSIRYDPGEPPRVDAGRDPLVRTDQPCRPHRPTAARSGR
jgi:hypothetical protein